MAGWCKANDVKFILDESFVDFSVGFENNTFVNNKILEMYPTMTVIKSISKSYGVPGLRLGIMCSSDISMISRIKKKVSIWNINSFAEYFMQIYPKYLNEYKCACEKLIEAREEFENELKKEGSLYKSDAISSKLFLYRGSSSIYGQRVMCNSFKEI